MRSSTRRKRSNPFSAPSVIFLLGPTGSGKTSLTASLLDKERHTVINGDSQQVYADLPAGTAAPGPETLASLPHKLFGFLPAGERMNASRFSSLVREEISRVQTEGRIPVVVGGSGLYLQSIVYGLDDLPEADQELRGKLEKEAASQGLAALYDKLKKIDPEYAEVIAPTDPVRIIRALEIWILSGKKLGELRNRPKKPAWPDALLIGLQVERETLYGIINARCASMLDSGWLDEAMRLLDKGHREWLLTVPAIGYDHITAFLEGRLDRTAMLELIRRDTRRYAKRQMTWFRKMPGVRWFPHRPGTVPEGLPELFKQT